MAPCSKSLPPSAKQKFNWAATAELTGHKDGKSCKEVFRQACERYGWLKADENENENGTPGSAASKKNTPGKLTKATEKKTAAAKNSTDEDDAASGVEIDTPSKASKKRKTNANKSPDTPSKKSKLKDEEVISDNLYEF